MKTKYLTGKDYPWLCPSCQAQIDALVDQADEMADTDNPEFACDWLYDRRRFCGGARCYKGEYQDAFNRFKKKHPSATDSEAAYYALESLIFEVAEDPHRLQNPAPEYVHHWTELMADYDEYMRDQAPHPAVLHLSVGV